MSPVRSPSLSRISFGRVVWPLLVILLVIDITIIPSLPPYSKEASGEARQQVNLIVPCCADCLQEALAGRLVRRGPIPEASKARRGDRMIPVTMYLSLEPEFCASSSEFTAAAAPPALVSPLVLAGVADGPGSACRNGNRSSGSPPVVRPARTAALGEERIRRHKLFPRPVGSSLPVVLRCVPDELPEDY